MTYVDDAFNKCKTTLEITTAEQNFASSKHWDIRTLIRESWQLDDDFLTGSYRRHTKTKRLKDVDIFVVIDPNGPQAYLRYVAPRKVLEALQAVLNEVRERQDRRLCLCGEVRHRRRGRVLRDRASF